MRAEAHSARIGAFLYRGDLVAADAALRELERVVHEARIPEAIWFHDRLRNQRRILDGDFAAAKAGCDELAARAERIGLSYGPLFVGSQRNSIALAEQGIEAARSLEPAGAVRPGRLQPSFRAGLVALSAELGQEQDARGMFETMSASGFDDVPKDIAYLNALSHLARAAVLLGEFRAAERLYERLTPYEQFNTPNSMLLYEGSAAQALAAVAALLGWDERAEAHFEAALAARTSASARARTWRAARSNTRSGWRAGAARRGRAAWPRARRASRRSWAWTGSQRRPLPWRIRVRACTSGSMEGMLPRLAPLLVGVPLAALCLAGCKRGDAQAGFAMPPPVVEVITVVPETVRDTVVLVGPARFGVTPSSCGPRSTGMVESIDFTEGQSVKKGDVLFRLRDAEQRAQLREAQARAKLAEEIFRRISLLADKEVSARVEFDKAAAELEVARAEVELREVELDKTQVRAPFDGVVGARLGLAGRARARAAPSW